MHGDFLNAIFVDIDSDRSFDKVVYIIELVEVCAEFFEHALFNFGAVSVGIADVEQRQVIRQAVRDSSTVLLDFPCLEGSTDERDSLLSF